MIGIGEFSMSAFLISLPEPTQAAVIALVVSLFAVLVRLVSNYLPWLGEFLDKYKEEWGTAVGIMLVNVLNQYLPGGEWAGASVLAVQLVVAVVTVLLAKYGLKKAKARGFR